MFRSITHASLVRRVKRPIEALARSEAAHCQYQTRRQGPLSTHSCRQLLPPAPWPGRLEPFAFACQRWAHSSAVDPLIEHLEHTLDDGNANDAWLAYIGLRNAVASRSLTPTLFKRLAHLQVDAWRNANPNSVRTSQPSGGSLASTLSDTRWTDRIIALGQDWLGQCQLPWVQPDLETSHRKQPTRVSLDRTKQQEAYQAVLDMYGQVGLAQEALALIEEAHTYHFPLASTNVCSVIKACSVAGTAEPALQLLPNALAWSISWNQQMCEELLQLVMAHASFEQTFSVYKTMQSMKLHPTPRITGQLAMAAAQHNLPNLVRDMYTAVTQTKSRPDQADGSTLDDATAINFIRAFGRLKDSKSAVDIYNRVHAQRPSIPSAAVNATLIETLIACKAYDRINQYYELFTANGQPVPTLVVNQVLRATLAQNRPQQALAYFDELVERLDRRASLAADLLPDSDSYEIIIMALCQEQQTDRADDLLAHMGTHGISPTATMFDWLLGSRLRQGRHARVIELFQQMVDLKLPVSNRAATTVMTTYIQSGDPDEACRLFDIFRYQDLEPNVYTYTTGLHALTLTGQMGKALSLFEEMHASGIHPSTHTYSVMIKGYALANDPHGVKLMHRLFNVNVCHEPDAPLYGTLIEAYNRVSMPLDAFQVWQLVCLANMPINEAIVAVAIDTCGFSGYLQHLTPILAYAQQQGIMLNVNHYTALAEAYLRHGLMDRSLAVLTNDVPAAGLVPDYKMLRNMHSLLLHFHQGDMIPRIDSIVESQFPQLTVEWQRVKQEYANQ
ncbi:hypothetical protein H4R34_005319 [Dimargaris verticillata]|uniref:Pentacotripeptide-repeat region of PRORP domain-containing protein n=1 Tax=Dimargaris verticillata TaxID=2761393 RepID=A0A9W8AYF2_9FUNG|nr:hypothetical protein H4R34_005319 [Dimargaris verticillata]